MHLLKWQYQPQKREYGHSWENSIRTHRKQARDLIEKYPSLEAKIISDWEGVFESALRSAVVDTDMTKEVLDVIGHLGGSNFQWARASGHCAGLYA